MAILWSFEPDTTYKHFIQYFILYYQLLEKLDTNKTWLQIYEMLCDTNLTIAATNKLITIDRAQA